MLDASVYEAVSTRRNGRQVKIRALRPDDRAELIAAIDRSSPESLYRRFFSPKRSFTEEEIVFFLNVDFVNHVALVALVEENGRPTIVGGGRYIIVQPGRAEVAFAVVDAYHGQGIGAALMDHLVSIACGAGVKELIAEVLHENIAMLRIFQRSGLQLSKKHEAGIVQITMQLLASPGRCGARRAREP
jgi:RimJ/RimL family protein N-acetyltransferase